MPRPFLPRLDRALPRQLGAILIVMVACLMPAHAQTPNFLEIIGKALKEGNTAAEQKPAPAAEPAPAADAAEAAPARNLTRMTNGKRLALVIGNDAYQRVSKLEKAGNDATAMARELKAAGFDVLLHRDLNYRGMVKAVETLANSITGGDQVVVFFAGHGVQLKTGSYLLPIDIEASSESEVEKTAYGLNDLTEKLAEAKASFTLVMVDACRDNPLKSKGRSLGATRGLSAIEPPKGQMVVYSASKGQQALDRLSDNDRNPNGVFTRAFIARMKKPGVRIEDMMREVQDAVEDLAKTVSHDQRPAIYNESRGNFYFFGPTTVQVQSAPVPSTLQPPPVAVSPAPTFKAPVVSSDPETQFWNEVKASGAREYLEAYLKQYPKGKYLALAKVELKKIAERQEQEAQQAEQNAWEQAKGENSSAGYAAYLERYPKGGYAALAQAGRMKAQREEAEKERRDAVQRKQDEERQKLVAERERRETEERARQDVARVAEEQRKEREEAARGPQWAESDNGADINWAEAKNYCAAKGGGWRLPTVAELQNSHQSGQSTLCGSALFGSWTCKVASKSRLTAPLFWSNEPNGSSAAWSVWLSDGIRDSFGVGRQVSRALCVRQL